MSLTSSGVLLSGVGSLNEASQDVEVVPVLPSIDRVVDHRLRIRNRPFECLALMGPGVGRQARLDPHVMAASECAAMDDYRLKP
ncbi:MAG: hypothetical protein ACR2RE_19710, partial [Geminicoccaceae bacterium]